MGGHLVVPKSPFVNRRSEGACMDTRLRQPNEYVSEKDDLSLSKSRGSQPSSSHQCDYTDYRVRQDRKNGKPRQMAGDCCTNALMPRGS